MTEKELDIIYYAAEHIYHKAHNRWYSSLTVLSFEEWFKGTSCENHYNRLQDILNNHKER